MKAWSNSYNDIKTEPETRTRSKVYNDVKTETETRTVREVYDHYKSKKREEESNSSMQGERSRYDRQQINEELKQHNKTLIQDRNNKSR